MAHLYLLMVVWVVLQVFWPANPSASWGSGGFLSYARYCLSLLRGWCVVYVGYASVKCPVMYAFITGESVI
jgi:hypothetical protein